MDLWTLLKSDLIGLGENWDVWTDWYEERLNGIPSIEPLEPARASIAETDWLQGPVFVNGKIRQQIDEIEKEIFDSPFEPESQEDDLSPPPPLEAIPEQTPTATSFGINARGLIDIVPDPPTDESLADPSQREHYDETRFKASTIVGLGPNQLGELTQAAARFLESLPEDMKDMSISIAWSRGNTLRCRLKAHDLSMTHTDPDPARLVPLVAESLRDLVDSWNVFIFGDGKGRELDERRFGPREAEAIRNTVASSKTILEAIEHSEDIATDRAKEAVVEQAQAAFDAPAGLDGDQANDLSRKTTGNFVAKILRIAYAPLGKMMSGTREEAAFAWKEMRGGVYKAGGAAIFTAGAGMAAVNWPNIVSFVANNAEALKAFVMTNWHNPTLVDIVELIARSIGQ